MLTEQEKKEIEAEFSKAERKQAAAVDALKVVQRHRGWVSDEALEAVAAMAAMSAAELDSVATFYNLIFRRPVGRNVILVCDTISCWITGQEDVYAHLKKRLSLEWGQTTADNRFTLLPVPCLGACEQAPAMMINDELYGNLTPEKLDTILAQFEGQEKD